MSPGNEKWYSFTHIIETKAIKPQNTHRKFTFCYVMIIRGGGPAFAKIEPAKILYPVYVYTLEPKQLSQLSGYLFVI